MAPSPTSRGHCCDGACMRRSGTLRRTPWRRHHEPNALLSTSPRCLRGIDPHADWGMSALVPGCASRQAKAENGVTVRGTPLARTLGGAVVTFAPHCEADTCRGMYVVVENRTDLPVDLDWPRVAFFVDGNPRGSFLGDGEAVPRTSLTKLPPTTVAPHQMFQAVLSPVSTSTYEEGQGWTTGELPLGRISGRFVLRRQVIPHTATFEYDIVPRAPATQMR